MLWILGALLGGAAAYYLLDKEHERLKKLDPPRRIGVGFAPPEEDEERAKKEEQR